MKISTRGRYGLLLLADLAEHSGEDRPSLTAVSERLGISLRYLEQLAMILKRNGFIRSLRGSSGGYGLARPTEDIVLADVLRVLEGDMLVADPPADDGKETKLQRCIRLMVLDKLNAKIAELIGSKTLASLTGAGHEELMYHI